MKPSRAWMCGARRRAHLAWLGSQHGRLHREQADGGSFFPEPILTQGPARNLALPPGVSSARVTHNGFDTSALARPAANCGMPAVVSTLDAGEPSSSLPGLENPSLGTKFIAPVLPTVINGLPSRCKSTALYLLKNAGSTTLGSQMKRQLCTLAGDKLVADSDDDNGSKFQRGNVEALRKRIVDDTNHTTTNVLDFKIRYKNYVRPQLISRCLVAPCPINDNWMVFLQRQTFEIFGHNPCYLSCFDIMAYEHVCKDGEWEMFLNHLLDRKAYVIEDWDSSYSTIETLMYYYGLRHPHDGSGQHIFKGECDASYDKVTKTASLSYIIWRDDQIVYSEVFSVLECSSSVEAEIYAAYALLYKAEQLKIRKLLLWTDSRTAAAVLTGEHPISSGDVHRDFYLTLRAMRKNFSWLMVSWKPRELMFFTDDLAKLAKLPISEPSAVKLALQKWSRQLRGLPVYRIERTKVTKKAVKKFKNRVLDNETYGMKGPDVFFVEVEEDRKLECLVALKQALNPSRLTVALDSYDDKCDSFKEQLGDVVFMKSRKDFGAGPMPGKCSTFSSESLPKGSMPDVCSTSTSNYVKESPPSECSTLSSESLPPGSMPDVCSTSTNKYVEESPPSKDLMVVLDYSVPRDVYYDSETFHVVLVTESERLSMTENIPELTALGFVYFNDVRFPLNEVKEDEEAQEGQK